MALTDQQQTELYMWVKELRSEVVLPKEPDTDKTRMDRIVDRLNAIAKKVGA